MYQNIVYLR